MSNEVIAIIIYGSLSNIFLILILEKLKEISKNLKNKEGN